MDLHQLYPRETITRPTILDMRRDGVFMAQHYLHPNRVLFTKNGMPTLCRLLNESQGRFPVTKQQFYFVCWGDNAHTRGWTVRFLRTTQFDELRRSHPSMEWVEAPKKG